MNKPHFVIFPTSDGFPEKAPMKAWVRDNPDLVPDGFVPGRKTSYQIRRFLRRNGWEMEEQINRVILIKPDENGSFSYAEELTDTDEGEEESNNELENAVEITFGLERDLQQSLRGNITQLESNLVIIDKGNERITDAGRIDITAKDKKGNIVIIELKAGTAQPEVIAQILAYMGAVAETDKKPMRGILVASDFHKRVIWAARAIPNLELRKYSFKFNFESVE